MAEKPTYEDLEQRVKELEAKDKKRKQTDEALKDIEAKSRNLLDLSPDPIAIMQNNKHTFINRKFTELFEYTMQDVDKGLSISQLVPGKDREMAVRQMKERLMGKELRSEYNIVDVVAKNGKIIPCEVTGNLIEYEGEPADLVIIRDITNRRQAEDALRKSEDKFQNLLKNSPDPIAIVQDRKNVFINQAYTELFGYTLQDVENGLSPEQLMLEKDKGKMLRRISDRLSRKEMDSKYTTLDLVAKDGKIIPCETSGSYIEYEGRPADMAILRDITERRQAQEALIKSEEELRNGAKDLGELNAALNVLLNKREEDKIKLEDNILSNVRTLIEPYLTKLKTGLSQDQKTVFHILESNLSEIISPFTRKLSSKYLGFTPSEIQVANLIKNGKTNKEIAEILLVAERTIAFHRENIRKKLGLTNQKTNLKTYLSSID